MTNTSCFNETCQSGTKIHTLPKTMIAQVNVVILDVQMIFWIIELTNREHFYKGQKSLVFVGGLPRDCSLPQL